MRMRYILLFQFGNVDRNSHLCKQIFFLSCTGGMGPLAVVVYKRIATYKLSFSLLCSAITCFRDSISSYQFITNECTWEVYKLCIQ